MTLLADTTSEIRRPSGPPVRRRFNVDEFHGMAQAGFLGPEHARMELLDGEILELMPIGQRHAAQTNRLTRVLSARLPVGFLLQVQNPIRLNRVSEPLPDISIVRGSELDFLQAPPSPAATVLLIEVADSSLEHDLGSKSAAYAQAGIPEYWVFDLENRKLRCFRNPENGEFRETLVLKEGDSVSLRTMSELSFSVTDLMLPAES
jgi:Uma2 family endonuclease